MSAPVDPWASAPAQEAQAYSAPPAQYAPPQAAPQYAPPPPQAAPEPAPAYAPPPAPPAAPAAPQAPAVPLYAEVDGKFVLTFKGGSGYEAPWLVAHLGSLQEAYNLVTDNNQGQMLKTILEKVQVIGSLFQGMSPGTAAAGQNHAPAARQPAPAAAQAPPANAPACPGPGWQYKTGVTKSGRNAGNTWQAWMPPKGSNESPVFFN